MKKLFLNHFQKELHSTSWNAFHSFYLGFSIFVNTIFQVGPQQFGFYKQFVFPLTSIITFAKMQKILKRRKGGVQENSIAQWKAIY